MSGVGGSEEHVWSEDKFVRVIAWSRLIKEIGLDGCCADSSGCVKD